MVSQIAPPSLPKRRTSTSRFSGTAEPERLPLLLELRGLGFRLLAVPFVAVPHDRDNEEDDQRDPDDRVKHRVVTVALLGPGLRGGAHEAASASAVFQLGLRK